MEDRRKLPENYFQIIAKDNCSLFYRSGSNCSLQTCCCSAFGNGADGLREENGTSPYLYQINPLTTEALLQNPSEMPTRSNAFSCLSSVFSSTRDQRLL